jgi:hypothetical protein
VGWLKVSMGQRSCDRTVCRIRCPSSCFHSFPNLARRQGNTTPEDPSTAQHHLCVASKRRGWISARALCLLPTDLVPGDQRQITAEVWLVAIAASSQQRTCGHLVWCFHEPCRILHSVFDCWQCSVNRRVSTNHDMVAEHRSRNLDWIPGG